jgi:hypothetical protein
LHADEHLTLAGHNDVELDGHQNCRGLKLLDFHAYGHSPSLAARVLSLGPAQGHSALGHEGLWVGHCPIYGHSKVEMTTR